MFPGVGKRRDFSFKKKTRNAFSIVRQLKSPLSQGWQINKESEERQHYEATHGPYFVLLFADFH